MQTVVSRFTVWFDQPFWVGTLEREDEDGYSVGRAVFGAEPTPPELLRFSLCGWRAIRLGVSLPGQTVRTGHANPKRRQRQAKRQQAQAGVGTKAQQALAKQREQTKQASQQAARARRDREKQRQFELRAEKRKQKHRGH